MATSREERMQQRMRGAQRHEVEDATFELIVPGVADELTAEQSVASARATPNTSAKRRRLDSDAATTLGSARSTRSAAPTERPATATSVSADVYDVPPSPDHVSPALSRASALPSVKRSGRRPHPLANDEAVEALPLPLNLESAGLDRSPAGQLGTSGDTRRRMRKGMGPAAASRVEDVLAGEAPEEVTQTVSSPLARKSRTSDGAALSAASKRGTASRRSMIDRGMADEGEDELSFENSTPLRDEPSGGVTSSSPLRRRATRAPAQAEAGTAQEVDDTEAAMTLGRKRPRRSLRGQSPDPISPEAGPEEAEREPKRRKKQVQVSPATQKRGRPKKTRKGRQPRAQPESEPEPEPVASPTEEQLEDQPEELVASSQPEDVQSSPRAGQPMRKGRKQTIAKPKRRSSATEPAAKARENPSTTRPSSQAKRKSPAADAPKEVTGRSNEDSIPVTVQRFTRKAPIEDDPDAIDILSTELPFAARGGVNTIDVLSTACEEIIDRTVSQLRDLMEQAEVASQRKEYRIKLRAVEAFREELQTRLLDHTILVDTQHSLRKRIRAAQREKQSLREDILRIKAEREQVALRMDAVRVQHEEATKDAVAKLDLSTAMHNVDLAVERGRNAPELTGGQRKAAELANLELAMVRVAEVACSNAPGKGGSGALRQVKDFNAFLERAVLALEAKTASLRGPA